jgi:hypothetical protein
LYELIGTLFTFGYNNSEGKSERNYENSRKMFEERARAVAVEDFLFTFVDTFMRFKLELVLCEWFSSPGREGIEDFLGKTGKFSGNCWRRAHAAIAVELSKEVITNCYANHEPFTKSPHHPQRGGPSRVKLKQPHTTQKHPPLLVTN